MRLAAYQFAVCGCLDQNLAVIKKAIDQAVKNNVDLIIFPECALTGYPPRNMEKSENIDVNAVHDAIEEIQSMADNLAIHIIVGTIDYSESAYHNRAYMLSPNKSKRWYGKRALYGWDEDNFKEGKEKGLYYIDGLKIGVRICFEVRFPEYFRELYMENTDLDIVLFYDVADKEDEIRYQMIRGHLITRAVENVTPVLSVNAIHPNQTAPTCFINASGAVCYDKAQIPSSLGFFVL
ncbi:MAG: carbon-nitrogen hydrolase family protein [Lachnospiraceae bacterium]|nr:carbon-nitrogen hydrolase family protein [Lachnospiraceae bacterium]